MGASRSNGNRRMHLEKTSLGDLESLRNVLDAIPLPVFIKDAQSRFLVLNRSMCELMGASHENLVGKSDHDFVAKEHADLFRSVDRHVLLSGGIDEKQEILPRNGKVHTIVTRKQRAYLPDGSPAIVACISDVTELQQRKQWWEIVFDQNPIPMWVFDKKSLRFLAVNQEAIRHYGYSREQFLSMSAVDVRPKEDVDAFCAAVGAVSDSYKASGVWRHVRADGNLIHVIPYSRAFQFEDHEAQLAALYDVTELKRAEDHILHLGTHDTLTDLPNRFALNQHLGFLLEQARFTREPLAVLHIDLVRFKEVNQAFGEAVGDGLLKEVALRLGHVARGAFLARIGGNEFAVVASGGEMPATAADIAERLLGSLAPEIDIDGRRLQVEARVGMAFHPSDGTDGATLLANAEAALSRAKTDNRGGVHAFELETDSRLRKYRALKQDLRMAIERNELRLVFQPQALVTGEITGFEALIRWHHPERGVVSPVDFIPLAEESRLIEPIGEWVLRHACEEAVSWAKPLQVAVNLSPVQFRNANLPALVARVLQETGLPPERLELEVTESGLFEDFRLANAILMHLRSLGVKLAMDDFGTGYSSLSYLRELPVGKIKIDRSFISRLQEDDKSAAIVRAIIQLGLTLSMNITAEGVETQEQLGFLRDEGCSMVQGYLIGKPLPIEEYEQRLDLFARA